jgi:hypothetical protein
MAYNDHDPLINDRYFTANKISGLPWELQYDEGTLTVNYARQSEVTSSLRAMLQASSERGDNFGTDEFDGPYMEMLVGGSFVFIVR